MPPGIDNAFPDYGIYSDCDYAIGYLTICCRNNCRRCVVLAKKGGIKTYLTYRELVCSYTNKLVLMDDNILACGFGIEQLRQLAEADVRVNIKLLQSGLQAY